VLRAYSWPGNLSELDAVLRSAAASVNGGRIDVLNLPQAIRTVAARSLDAGAKPDAMMPPMDEVLTAVERRLIQLALKKAKGNKTEAAAMLQIWRPRLTRRLESLGLEPSNSTEEPTKQDDHAPPEDRSVRD
jgi:DNA-binding NtrC family response regulator